MVMDRYDSGGGVKELGNVHSAAYGALGLCCELSQGFTLSYYHGLPTGANTESAGESATSVQRARENAVRIAEPISQHKLMKMPSSPANESKPNGRANLSRLWSGSHETQPQTPGTQTDEPIMRAPTEMANTIAGLFIGSGSKLRSPLQSSHSLSLAREQPGVLGNPDHGEHLDEVRRKPVGVDLLAGVRGFDQQLDDQRDAA
jgi:hypothetical protein